MNQSAEGTAVVGCRLVMPNGSLQDVSHQLMSDAGMPIVRGGSRSYAERVLNPALFPPPRDLVRLMRPQDIPWVIAEGHADLGFTGNDLIAESDCGNNVMILRRYPLSRGGAGGTNIVLAVSADSPITAACQLTASHEIVTEFPDFTRRWFESHQLKPKIRRCHGSAESFKGIADAIVDITETGRSLRENGWRVIETLLANSQLCLVTHPEGFESDEYRRIIDPICLLLDSVMAARERQLIKCNVADGQLTAVLAVLPAARPTISPLAGNGGHAVEAVVLASQIPELITKLKAAGATSIFDQAVAHFVP